MIKERDRELSEEKLINALGELIEEVGFENLGINQVAKRAGFSKNLIYRYFDSLDGLIYAYMKKHDFWARYSDTDPDYSDLKGYLKKMYRRQILELREDIVLKRLRRWELSANNNAVLEIRSQRERNGVHFVDTISQFTKINKKHLKAVSALLNAGLTYLAMLEDNCQMYNDIDIQSDEGWQQITEGIDYLIDIMM